ncbi:MAG: AMP-binding protein, partial [Nostoc sp.]
MLPPQNFQEEPQKLTKLIAENKISHLLSLPSLYALILAQSEPKQLVWLRTVIVAGEPCPAALVKLHNQRLGHTSLFNEYGPTEATVWSSVYKCQSQ